MQLNLKSIYSLILLIVILLVIIILKSYWGASYSEGLEDFPAVISFSNLHQTESFVLAKDTLDNVSGIYSISHNENTKIYIGSSQDLGSRIMEHLFYRRTNPHLINALVSMALLHLLSQFYNFVLRKLY